MSSTNHWSPSAPQGCIVGALLGGGVFLLACGFGMNSVAVVVLGVAVAVLGPLLVMTIGLRNGGKDFVYGTAHVHEVSEAPATGMVGRCELEVVVEAKGLTAIPVRIRDHTVPVNKWPELGQALPVMVMVRDPRQIRVLWDEISPHRSFPRAIPLGDSAGGKTGSTHVDDYLDGNEAGYEDGEFEHDDLDQDADPLFGFGEAPGEPREPASPASHDVDADAHDVDIDAHEGPARPYQANQSLSPSTAVMDSPPVPKARRPESCPAAAPNSTSEPPQDDPAAIAPAQPPASEPTKASSTLVPTNGAGIGSEEPEVQRPAGSSDRETTSNGVSVTLIVSDLTRSRDFYRDTLGLRELDTSRSSAVLAFGEARVVLRQVTDMPPIDRRLVHLNLDVPDVQEAYERMRERGVEFVHRPRVVQQGEHLELCSATFRDPDGHAIALTRWAVRR